MFAFRSHIVKFNSELEAQKLELLLAVRVPKSSKEIVAVNSYCRPKNNLVVSVESHIMRRRRTHIVGTYERYLTMVGGHQSEGDARRDEMDAHILSAPRGFTSSIELMNKIAGQDPETFSSFVAEVFQNENQPSSMTKQLSGVTDEQNLGLVNSLGFIYRGCVDRQVDSASLRTCLGSNTECTQNVVEILSLRWEESLSSTKTKLPLNVGQLVGLEYKLGVAVASSSCSELLSPFVILVFQVVDMNGSITTQRVELTYSEFLNMSKVFTDVALKLDKL